MGQNKSSSNDTTETILKVFSVIGKVVLTILKWCLITAFWLFFEPLHLLLHLAELVFQSQDLFPNRGEKNKY